MKAAGRCVRFRKGNFRVGKENARGLPEDVLYRDLIDCKEFIN